MPSGVVFVAILVIWAVILAPRAMKLYERTATQRTTKRFSSAMAVLGSGKTVARVAVDTARRGSKVVVDTRAPGVSATPTHQFEATAEAGPRPLSRATQRRRRVAAVCAGALTIAVVAALVGVVPWVVVPAAGLPLVLFLGACAARPMQRRGPSTARVPSQSQPTPQLQPQTDATAPAVVMLATRRARRSGLRPGSWTQARVLEADLAIAGTYGSVEEQLGLEGYVASPSDVDGQPYLRAANE